MSRPLTMAVATLLLAACSDSPAAPEAANPGRFAPSRAAFSRLGSGVASDINLALDDVRDRLVPTLTNPTVASRLRTLIGDVESKLGSGDVDSAKLLVAEAQVTIDPNADESPSDFGDPADVAVIRLTLANVASALGE
jgi:ribosomal protein S20